MVDVISTSTVHSVFLGFNGIGNIQSALWTFGRPGARHLQRSWWKGNCAGDRYSSMPQWLCKSLMLYIGSEMKLSYPKFTLSLLYLVISWHLGHSAIVAGRDLTAVGVMLGAIATGVLYFVGADVYQQVKKPK